MSLRNWLMTKTLQGFVAAIVFAVSVVLPLAPGASVMAAEKTSLQLDFSWWAPQIGIMHAYNKGYYKDAGLDFELRQGTGSGATIAAVSQGTYDFGFADISAAAQAIAKGANLKVVAMLSQKNGLAAVCRKDSGIKTPKDIEGKKMGVIPTGNDSLLYPAFFKANDIDTSKVQIINLPGDAKLTALVLGQAHCVSGNGFYYAALARSKGVEVVEFTYSDFGVPLLGYGIIVNGEVLKSKPDVVRKVIAVTIRGYQETFATIDAGIDSYLAVAELKEDRALIADIYKKFEALFDSPDTKGKPMGLNSKKNWEDTLKNLRTYSGMPEGNAPEDFFTNEYLPK